jgi:hypothetical protein
MPSACIGAANTLDEARAAYRTDLVQLRNIDGDSLPPAVEQLESVTSGIWIRAEVGTDRLTGSPRQQLMEALAARVLARDDLSAALANVSGAEGMPVVVVVDAERPLASVFDQMTAFDILWIVCADDLSNMAWAALCGPQARLGHTTGTRVEAAAVRNMSIASFVAEYATGDSRLVRVY